MPSIKKVVLVHKDQPDVTYETSERSAEIHKAAGWKLASKSQQPAEPAKS